jgi:hypothetical protein
MFASQNELEFGELIPNTEFVIEPQESRENIIISSTTDMFEDFEKSSDDFVLEYFSDFLHTNQNKINENDFEEMTNISEFLQTDQTEKLKLNLEPSFDQNLVSPSWNAEGLVKFQSKSAQNSIKILIPKEIKSISKKSKMKEEKGKPRIFVNQTRTDQNFRTSRPARCQNVTCEQHWLLEEARNQTFISTEGNGTKCVKCQNNAQYFHGYKEIKQEIKEIWRSRAWFVKPKQSKK